MIGAAIPFRKVWIIGLPVAGYVLLNIENNQIMYLYTNKQPIGSGKTIGSGKKLVDKVKLGRSFLKLCLHSQNITTH